MRALPAAAWAGAGVLAMRGAAGTVNAAASCRWLAQPRGTGPMPSETPGLRFVLVVPLLREQDIIGDLATRLAALARSVPGTAIALVTTQAEHVQRERAAAQLADLAARLAAGDHHARLAARFPGLLPASRLADLARTAAGRAEAECRELAAAALAATPTTAQLAAQLAAQRWPGTVMRHWHCPGPDATMARQVNFAVRAEAGRAQRDGIPAERLFFVLYNADSRPHPQTLRAAAELITRLAPDPGGPARIVQQPAIFTANLADLPAGTAGSMLAGAGWLQSRWTLSREIPRLRRQAAQARSGRPVRLARLAHCVGHGLLIRADTFAELGGLPESTLNEDLAFGYLACAAGIPIDPLPLLEQAQTPATLPSWISQGRRWFRSYPQYPHAAALAAAAGHGDPRRRACLTVQGLARGGIWLAQSPVLVLALALPALTRHRLGAAALSGAGVVTYYVAPAALAARQAGQPFRPSRSVPGGTCAALLSSAGPWWSLAELAWSAVTGERPASGKTER